MVSENISFILLLVFNYYDSLYFLIIAYFFKYHKIVSLHLLYSYSIVKIDS